MLNSYSVRNDFAGLTIAARVACIPTVNSATSKAIIADIAKNQILSGTR